MVANYSAARSHTQPPKSQNLRVLRNRRVSIPATVGRPASAAGLEIRPDSLARSQGSPACSPGAHACNHRKRHGHRRRCLPGARRDRRQPRLPHVSTRRPARREHQGEPRSRPRRDAQLAATTSPSRGSPSTSRPATSARPGPAFDLPIAVGMLAATGRRQAHGLRRHRPRRRAVARRIDPAGARRAADRRGGAAQRRARAAAAVRQPRRSRGRLRPAPAPGRNIARSGRAPESIGRRLARRTSAPQAPQAPQAPSGTSGT